jgi:hypothetical protein
MNAFDKAKIMPSTSVYQRLDYIFTLADESDFLSGRKSPNSWCGFDWLINSTNALKVIEGNYKNTGGGNSGADHKQAGNIGRSDSTVEAAMQMFRNKQKRLSLLIMQRYRFC